jgi:hypothetical protein
MAETNSTDSTVLAGVFSTLFTIGSYVLYKLVKRFGFNSKCTNGELRISIEDLQTKVSETHEVVRMFTSEVLRAYRHQQQDVPFECEVVTEKPETKTE